VADEQKIARAAPRRFVARAYSGDQNSAAPNVGGLEGVSKALRILRGNNSEDAPRTVPTFRKNQVICK
jgi:hypothetical protein